MKIGILCTKEWGVDPVELTEFLYETLRYLESGNEGLTVVVNNTTDMDAQIVEVCVELGIDITILSPKKYESWIHANLDLINSVDKMAFVWNGTSEGIRYSIKTAEFLNKDHSCFIPILIK